MDLQLAEIVKANAELLDVSLAQFISKVYNTYETESNEYFDEVKDDFIFIMSKVFDTDGSEYNTLIKIGKIIVQEEGFFTKRTLKDFSKRFDEARGGVFRPHGYIEQDLLDVIAALDIYDITEYEFGQEWTLLGVPGRPGIFVENERYLRDLKKENKNYYVAIANENLEYFGKLDKTLGAQKLAKKVSEVPDDVMFWQYAFLNAWDVKETSQGTGLITRKHGQSTSLDGEDYILYVPVSMFKLVNDVRCECWLTEDMLKTFGLPYWNGQINA